MKWEHVLEERKMRMKDSFKEAKKKKKKFMWNGQKMMNERTKPRETMGKKCIKDFQKGKSERGRDIQSERRIGQFWVAWWNRCSHRKTHMTFDLQHSGVLLHSAFKCLTTVYSKLWNLLLPICHILSSKNQSHLFIHTFQSPCLPICPSHGFKKIRTRF